MFKKTVAGMNVPAFAFVAISTGSLRAPALRCARNAATEFFGVQWRARFSPGLKPLSSVDHALDPLVPFTPGYIHIYMDFIPFWIRTAAWLHAHYGKRAAPEVGEFIDGIAGLYKQAALVYRARLSTTKRPFYIKRPRFALIHVTDPHFACVPSLHVMIVVYAWLAFREFVRRHDEEAAAADRIRELRAGALAITESILYVKQHSVNCVSAAMYAIAILYPKLITVAESEEFIMQMFAGKSVPAEEDAVKVKAHILDLFRQFMSEGKGVADWRMPLLDFLAGLETKPGI